MFDFLKKDKDEIADVVMKNSMNQVTKEDREAFMERLNAERAKITDREVTREDDFEIAKRLTREDMAALNKKYMDGAKILHDAAHAPFSYYIASKLDPTTRSMNEVPWRFNVNGKTITVSDPKCKNAKKYPALYVCHPYLVNDVMAELENKERPKLPFKFLHAFEMFVEDARKYIDETISYEKLEDVDFAEIEKEIGKFRESVENSYDMDKEVFSEIVDWFTGKNGYDLVTGDASAKHCKWLADYVREHGQEALYNEYTYEQDIDREI